MAKKAFKYHKDIIGLKFLENEQSILAKLPKYIDKAEWDKVLELSEYIYDETILMQIFDKIFKKTNQKEFIKLVGKYPKIKTYMIKFIKSHLPVALDTYMELFQSPEELFFYYLEQYFQTSEIAQRKRYIYYAKENQKLIDNTINPNFDHKFYKSYLDYLEYNITFKLDCLSPDKNIIPAPEQESFDISIYDVFLHGIVADKINWIENQNKTVNFSNEGMAIMRLMGFGQTKKLDIFSDITKKNNLKKLNLTFLNLAEAFFKFETYDVATKYIKLITEPVYFDYKLDLLKSVDRLEDALEIILTDKSIDNPTDLVKEIIERKPQLFIKAKRLADKNKVTLNLE